MAHRRPCTLPWIPVWKKYLEDTSAIASRSTWARPPSMTMMPNSYGRKVKSGRELIYEQLYDSFNSYPVLLKYI